MRVLGAGVVALLAAGVITACEPAPPKTVYDAACDGSLVASTPGTVAYSQVVELSGLVASRRNAGVWWVHNDSGTGVRNVVYAVGDDGRQLGAFTLTGTTNVDWEDIAVGPGPVAGTSYLYVADIGNNGSSKRNAVDVYRVPEPAVSPSTSSGVVNLAGATKLTYAYPGGATPDAEALLVDPADGALFVVTKVVSGPAQVYRANSGTGAWDAVGTVPLTWVTAADVTPAGDFVALRTYGSVLIFPRPAGQSLVAALGQAPCAGATAVEAQGEAIGFTPDGRGYVTASEGASPTLHEFHAP